MAGKPANCPHRQPLTAGGHYCLRVGEITGIRDPSISLVEPDACRACLGAIRHDEPVNPVTASLAYNALASIAETGGHPECSIERARSLRQCVAGHVGLCLDRLGDEVFPPPKPTHCRMHTQAGLWAVGMMTAPRSEPTLQQSLSSLRRSGFRELYLFAEPGTKLPQLDSGVTIIKRSARLGTMVNFYSALTTLLQKNPKAEYYAVFQDDIETATGLRSFCEKELWPLGSGIVSLFTPRLHATEEKGWSLASPGYQRICGAQAMVLRRDIAERFLSDAGVLYRLTAKRHNNDAVLAGWAAREGLAIAYHTPSLVGHIGRISSLYAIGPDRRNEADTVARTSEIAAWRTNPRPASRIGLIGPNTATGLGYQTKELAEQLEVDRWFLVDHGRKKPLPVPHLLEDSTDPIPNRLTDDEIRKRFSDLDWLLFVERPHLRNLVRVASQAGVGIACIPNWEWLQPDLRWLPFVDVMFCPTRHTYLLLEDWKRRFGFGWKNILLPYPIDAAKFPFVERRKCRRFLFVNGWGGSEIRYPDGGPVPYRRKGWECIREAARLAPDLAFVVISQKNLRGEIPPNIVFREPPRSNALLYQVGDVCVQPSHYEGLGLQLLECQAAGMPLITTDAPPMNEYRPWKTIPLSGREIIDTGPGPIPSALPDPEALVRILRGIHGVDLRDASQSAHAFALGRSWSQAKETLRETLVHR